MKHSISQSKKGNYDFIFGALILILGANQPDYPNAMADSAAAIENMWLTAVSLGLGGSLPSCGNVSFFGNVLGRGSFWGFMP